MSLRGGQAAQEECSQADVRAVQGVDQYVFERQMDEWYSLPFNVLNTEGPQAFAPDMRAFPALVFQLIATALLILGSGPDPTFDSLKYNSSM